MFILGYLELHYPIMNNSLLENLLSTDVQASVEPHLSPSITSRTNKIMQSNILNFNMIYNQASEASETYNFKMIIFEDFQSEDIFLLLKNYNNVINGKVTATFPGCTNYLGKLLVI